MSPAVVDKAGLGPPKAALPEARAVDGAAVAAARKFKVNFRKFSVSIRRITFK
jgi:hypothetical protein